MCEMKCLHHNLHWPGNYHEIASLAAIQQPALIVFVGDHRQTLEDYLKVELQQPTGRNFSSGHLAKERSIEWETTYHLLISPTLSLGYGLMRAKMKALALTLRGLGESVKSLTLVHGLQQGRSSTCRLP